MNIKYRNAVIFAKDQSSLVEWYQKIFGFQIVYEHKGDYHYTELGFSKENGNPQIILGISPAQELDHQLSQPKNNAVVLQFEVENIQTLMQEVEASGGSVLFGPSLEEEQSFYYGGVKDIEGNELWFIQNEK